VFNIRAVQAPFIRTTGLDTRRSFQNPKET